MLKKKKVFDSKDQRHVHFLSIEWSMYVVEFHLFCPLLSKRGKSKRLCAQSAAAASKASAAAVRLCAAQRVARAVRVSRTKRMWRTTLCKTQRQCSCVSCGKTQYPVCHFDYVSRHRWRETTLSLCRREARHCCFRPRFSENEHRL